MTRDDFFQPSPELGQKALDFLNALAAEMPIPASATQPMVIRGRLNAAVYVLIKIAENAHGAELAARHATDDQGAEEAKAFMTGVGHGLASYLLTTENPPFFLGHITACAQISIARQTAPEGPKQ